MGPLVLDLEVELPVSNWDDARKGLNGVSVICVYNGETKDYFFFDKHNWDQLIPMIQAADPLVTFNGKEFDIPCLEGALDAQICPYSHIDVLQEIWATVPEKRYQKGYGLGPTCERTLGGGKYGTGTHAPTLWSTGRIAELYTYCLRDVFLTHSLYSHILEHGYIIDPDGEELEISIGESCTR